MIRVRHLTRRFGAFTAVDDISFELEKGEVVGFLGPNGAGKTTTIRMLTGFLPATSGSIEVAGFDVLRQSLEVRKRIGYLPESVPLYREHRVEEMLLFQARLHAVNRADAKRRIGEVLERVGLADRRRSVIGKLSKGQRQRIGLAVALLPDPEVLILDEPTSGLDPLQRLEVRELVRELAEERTVLFSSHILPEVEAVCPRVVILHKGKIAADGTRDGLVQELGSGAHVRMEAVLGGDVGEAMRLLSTLPGVTRVDDKGRVGIHHALNVHADEDLREDIGALAMQRGWALRELSWQAPSLERLFARIALEIDHDDSDGEPASSVASPAAQPASTPGELPQLQTAAPVEEAPKVLFNLNPFDGGAGRDLSQPKAVGPTPTVPAPDEPQEDGTSGG